jgi:exodeoxyribonuclease V beta subunit
MESHEYFLQATIYAEALKRYLTIIEEKSFKDIFGGAIYIFVRGLDASGVNGIVNYIPDFSLLPLK